MDLQDPDLDPGLDLLFDTNLRRVFVLHLLHGHHTAVTVRCEDVALYEPIGLPGLIVHLVDIRTDVMQVLHACTPHAKALPTCDAHTVPLACNITAAHPVDTNTVQCVAAPCA